MGIPNSYPYFRGYFFDIYISAELWLDPTDNTVFKSIWTDLNSWQFDIESFLKKRIETGKLDIQRAFSLFDGVGIVHGGPHITTPRKFLDSVDVVVGVRPEMALFPLSGVKHEIRISKS